MHKHWREHAGSDTASDTGGAQRSSRERDVVGSTFAGLPGIVLGRNNNVSWGVTNTGVDVQDLYVLTVR